MRPHNYWRNFEPKKCLQNNLFDQDKVKDWTHCQMIFSKLFSEQWYQQVECLAESMFVETWGRNNNYHLEKKLYQQEIIHILKHKSKSIIYLAVHQGNGDNNQGEVGFVASQ